MTQSFENDINNNFASAKSAIAELASNTAPISLVQTVNGLSNNKQDKSNLVTTLSASSTDAEYPSAKLMYNKLALKSDSGHTHAQYLTQHQDISGKVNISDIASTVSASSTNAVPVGAKLFYDTLNGIETLLQGV